MQKNKISKARKLLLEGAEEAARFLVAALSSDDATMAQKIDCAKDILNRVLGKTLSDEETEEIRIILSEEAKRLSK